MKNRSLLRTLLAALAAVVLAGLLAACGGADEDSNSSSAGNGTDLAFVDEMVAHHEGAIEMAEIAQKQGQSQFVRQLADDIVDAQEAEITVMQKVRKNLESGGIEAEDLGIAENMMGMDMDMTALESADPFDREFVDMMIAHHQGAIRMARVEQAEGQSEALKQLADDVIVAQTREIEEMNAFREKTYGEPSPSGGVPPEDEQMSESSDDMGGMEGMGH